MTKAPSKGWAIIPAPSRTFAQDKKTDIYYRVTAMAVNPIPILDDDSNKTTFQTYLLLALTYGDSKRYAQGEGWGKWDDLDKYNLYSSEDVTNE